ncbi:MAG: TIGR01777 family oxidoreductase [Planctomycetota bacterium]
MDRIAISGSTGLVGSALQTMLKEKGYEVLSLVRSNQKTGILWDPEKKEFQTDALEGSKALIHLAGHTVAQRWSAKVKEKILTSRVDGTRLIVDGLRRMKNPPNILISASAVGYYGNRGEEILTEDAKKGEDFFLCRVVEEWEAEAQKAEAFGIRVIRLRFGVILSTKGGALKKMLLPFKMGLGGPISHGQQWMPWISLNDTLRAICFSLENTQISGVFNVVSPQPTTNKEFSKTLGRVLHRPAFFPLPAFQAKLIFGEMAKELLLASTRCEPKRLLEQGFTFEDPSLQSALQKILTQHI